MLKIAKQFVEESTYPWINYWLRLAGNALARHKEERIFSFITMLGVPVFDNSTTTRTVGYAGHNKPVKGMTTGQLSRWADFLATSNWAEIPGVRPVCRLLPP
jgi:hypothetical protein